jgi:multiple sugar transport system substrate-binding protein
MKWAGRLTWIFFYSFIGATAARAEPLVINANASDPIPREAFAAIAGKFQKENPDLQVQVNYYDHESYKIALRSWLTAEPPDVVLWFAGNRMRQLVRLGLLADVSDIWTADRRSEFNKAAIELVSDGRRQFGVPYSSYGWSIYARGDLLASSGVGELRTWDELKNACKELRSRSVDPIVIGTKQLWPAGGWFDYIDLRLNGLPFHTEVMDGGVSFTDDRIKAVFRKWRELIDLQCFNADHASLGWQQAQARFLQGKAALTLIGSFFVPNIPAELEPEIRMYPFPRLDPAIEQAEEAPMNSVHIPAKAKHPDAARRFLVFMMRQDVQGDYNAQMASIAPNRLATKGASRLLDEGRQILASASGFSQFIDRDASEELALAALNAFQEFMLAPDTVDRILDRLERTRIRLQGRN